MALPIKWTKEAKATYNKVLFYLNEKWTDKEVVKFIRKTESTLLIISLQPYIFKPSKYKRIRKAVLDKQNSLIYLVHDTEILLLTFWDNRQDPKKNKY